MGSQQLIFCFRFRQAEEGPAGMGRNVKEKASDSFLPGVAAAGEENGAQMWGEAANLRPQLGHRRAGAEQGQRKLCGRGDGRDRQMGGEGY